MLGAQRFMTASLPQVNQMTAASDGVKVIQLQRYRPKPVQKNEHHGVMSVGG